MKRFADILSAVRLRLVPVLMAALASVSSCDNVIFDDEGDCTPYYKVRFVYDMNMKWADAFSNEVNEVTLYLLDEDGRIVWQKHEAGAAVKAPGYTMDVDVDPGTYTLIAWCGEGHTTSFAVDGTDLSCTLLRDRDARGKAYIDHDINRLYHGRLTAREFPETEGTHLYTVPLVKNTNDVRVVLQHLSGEPVDKDRFTFTITSDNGTMEWNNDLRPEETITYYAWHTDQGTAAFDYPEYRPQVRALSSFSAAIAEFTIARLVKETGGKPADVRLTVYNDKGEVVFSIPLIDYCLMVKGAHNRHMSDQEYLDRQDEYSMTFFLDEGNRWVNSFIYINSWKVVLQHSSI